MTSLEVSVWRHVTTYFPTLRCVKSYSSNKYSTLFICLRIHLYRGRRRIEIWQQHLHAFCQFKLLFGATAKCTTLLRSLPVTFETRQTTGKRLPIRGYFQANKRTNDHRESQQATRWKPARLRLLSSVNWPPCYKSSACSNFTLGNSCWSFLPLNST